MYIFLMRDLDGGTRLLLPFASTSPNELVLCDVLLIDVGVASLRPL